MPGDVADICRLTPWVVCICVQHDRMEPQSFCRTNLHWMRASFVKPWQRSSWLAAWLMRRRSADNFVRCGPGHWRSGITTYSNYSKGNTAQLNITVCCSFSISLEFNSRSHQQFNKGLGLIPRAKTVMRQEWGIAAAKWETILLFCRKMGLTPKSQVSRHFPI